MPLIVPLPALQKGTVRLVGELTAGELALDTLDPCIEAHLPVAYDLSAQLMGRELLVEGSLETTFTCQCVRCLVSFEHKLRLDPWSSLLPLEGEESAPIVHDAVDLTPQIREDSLLALPQHPVCRPDCRGMPWQGSGPMQAEGQSDESQRASSAWSILDTLKLDR